MQAPINLRVEQEPYPHLRDDQGCILARDYQHPEKLEYILEAVRQMQQKESNNATRLHST